MYKENFAQMKNDKRIIGQTFYQKRKISTEFFLVEEWVPKTRILGIRNAMENRAFGVLHFEKSSNMAKIC